MPGIECDSESGDFERHVLVHRTDVLNYALALCRNVHDAEDLAQETMLRAFRAHDRLPSTANHRAWLLTIARNTWISRHRSTLCRPAERLVGDTADGRLDAAAMMTGLVERSAESEVLRRGVDGDLLDALLDLPEELRRTVYYVAVAGLRYREVAVVMGLPEGTVLSRMHRVRRRLRDALESAGTLARQRGADEHLRRRVRPPRKGA